MTFSMCSRLLGGVCRVAWHVHSQRRTLRALALLSSLRRVFEAQGALTCLSAAHELVYLTLGSSNVASSFRGWGFAALFVWWCEVGVWTYVSAVWTYVSAGLLWWRRDCVACFDVSVPLDTGCKFHAPPHRRLVPGSRVCVLSKVVDG